MHCDCLTDTDSYVFELTCDEPNPFNALLPILHRLETSSFPADHVLYKEIEDSAKMGLLQIETGGIYIIAEFYGCRAKNYYISLYNPATKEFRDIKRVKGMTRASQKTLEMAHFRRCIFNKTIHRADQNAIRSYNTLLYTIKTTKTVLNSLDFKRFILDT